MGIEEEYKSACLAEEVEGGYNRNKQNWGLLEHERYKLTGIADDEARVCPS
jgi:hypothetical protein